MNNLHNCKIGVLGGGQLGRMLVQEASTLDLDIHFLDKSTEYPVPRMYPNYTLGDFNNYDDVLAFGQDKDIITIEIENVNTDALRELESQGKKVYPQADVIATIKDKGLQKKFYQERDLPTSRYYEVDNKEQVLQLVTDGKINYPFIQKSRLAGYDGKGVVKIESEAEHYQIFDVPSIVEEFIVIDKELALTICRNASGELSAFPVVEMVFNKKGNLLDYLICPSDISDAVADRCEELAKDIITKLDMVGILAVEFFLTPDGEVLINEVAPRAHNSGHHTIDATNYSQYQMHIRCLLNLKLPQLKQEGFALMYNLLGEPEHTGAVQYAGLAECLNRENVIPHLYGKVETRPLRKMGHVNILGQSKTEVLEKYNFVKENLKVISCPKQS